MDSLKVPKNSGNKSSSPSSVPMAIRFNAGDEVLEDILKPTITTDSSPIQNTEDFNWRKDFLQGSFFNRKRSGSIDGDRSGLSGLAASVGVGGSTNVTNSPNTSIISNISNSDTNAVGTWKLIKGKVSQAMEDIKSSKHQQSSQQQQHQQQQQLPSSKQVDINDDSDLDNATINSSISDELSLDTPSQSQLLNDQQQANSSAPTTIKSQKYFYFGRKSNKSDSDSDIDPDILTIDHECESSGIRKSLANLRTKSTHNKADDVSPTRSQSIGSTTSNTIRNTFLRKRKKPTEIIKQQQQSIQNPQPDQSQKLKKNKDFEIESGVEMLEDMVIVTNKSTQNPNNQINANISNVLYTKNLDNNDCPESLKISLSTDTIKYKNNNNQRRDNENDNVKIVNIHDKNIIPSNNNNETIPNIIKKLFNIRTIFYSIQNYNIWLSGFLLVVLILIPIADFFRGIIACLLTISLFNAVWEYIRDWINLKLNPTVNKNNGDLTNGNGPEKCQFQIPDYSKMKLFEIPNIEEHKPFKSYSGWMNEINNYDPNNYHISLTRSVYIRLDGSILRISNTTTRIPKRSMWNEQNVERKNITFSRNRCFNLLGCRVEMLPRGLARKRYFSRKYPIQLIIKNYDNNVDGNGQQTSINFNDDDRGLEKSNRQTTEKLDSFKNTSSSNNGNEQRNNSIDGIDNTNSTASTPPAQPHPPVISVSQQSSNESNEDRNSVIANEFDSTNLDFGSTILNSDLQKLQATQNLIQTKDSSVPYGDETRILLFARGDREKEDWYRRFYSASIGAINDQDLRIPDIVMITDDDIVQAIKATTAETDVSESSAATDDTNNKSIKLSSNIGLENGSGNSDNQQQNDCKSIEEHQPSLFEGLILSSCAARNPPEYIKFMSRYQKACTQSNIPVVKNSLTPSDSNIKRNRRQKRQEDELWKGIDQSLYLGPSGSVVWANVLIGRILFSCLNDTILLEKIQEFLQRKLSAIRLPSFMEDVSIAQVYLGETPPLIHRISQPQLDERGTWIDADITYEGLMHMTITTKLNLLRLKRSQRHHRHQTTTTTTTAPPPSSTSTSTSSTTTTAAPPNTTLNVNNPANTSTATTPTHTTSIDCSILGGKKNDTLNFDQINNLTINNTDENILSFNNNNDFNTNTNNINPTTLLNSAIYDSNAESSGASSSDSESQTVTSIDGIPPTSSNDVQSFHPTPGGSRRLLRIVDRITASNLFQSATEISYIQRAMENMSTKITLRVELKGLVSRVVVNIPPPPSDRIWVAFRGPPRLWISAKPAVGDHTFDWSIVTNVIENKLCDEVYKYLVYPNMVDIIVPFLGQSTYKE